MREGCEMAQAELEKVQKQYKETSETLDREMNSLESVRDELEYKVNVAAAECAKWTDNTLQVCQGVIHRAAQDNADKSQPTLSMDHLLQQFPYLERVLEDCDTNQLSHLYEMARNKRARRR